MQTREGGGGRVKIMALASLAILLAVLAGGGVFLKIMHDKTVFFDHTTVNGYEAAGLTPEEMQQMLLQKYRSAVVEITENGNAETSGTLADFGYEIDEEKLLRLMVKAKETERSSIGALLTGTLRGNAFIVQVPFIVDDAVLSAAASKTSFATPRTGSKDAYLSFDEQSKTYSIVPEEYGNDFEDASLKAIVQERINTFTEEKQAGTALEVEIPEEIYIPPAVYSNDPDLNEKNTVYNQFCKSEINYQFGSVTEKLPWDTIRDWIVISDGAGVPDEEKVMEYVQYLEGKYNTRYHTRHFHTSVGTDIDFPDYMNEYGYIINESAEFEKLLSDINSNSSVTREPVYYAVTDDGYETPVFYRREGTDDLAGSYVEVNLTAQHLWFYKYGSLVVESDIVSGCVSKGTETQTGVFPLAYKESPSVLTGGNAANGYSTPVQYWMPFYEGQGLHDANWRGAFGGSIYVNSGSHGCVNLPPWAAAEIYSEIEPGMAILIYH